MSGAFKEITELHASQEEIHKALTLLDQAARDPQIKRRRLTWHLAGDKPLQGIEPKTEHQLSTKVLYAVHDAFTAAITLLDGVNDQSFQEIKEIEKRAYAIADAELGTKKLSEDGKVPGTEEEPAKGGNGRRALTD